MEVVALLSQGRTAAAQCGLFTHKSVPVIFEPPCICIYAFELCFSPEVAFVWVASLLLIREIRVQISAQSDAVIFRRFTYLPLGCTAL